MFIHYDNFREIHAENEALIKKMHRITRPTKELSCETKLVGTSPVWNLGLLFPSISRLLKYFRGL